MIKYIIKYIFIFCFPIIAISSTLQTNNLIKSLKLNNYNAIPVRMIPNGLIHMGYTPVVDISLDKKNYYPFILDSGAALTVIDPIIDTSYLLKHNTKYDNLLMGGADSKRHVSYPVTIPYLFLNNFIASNNIAYTQSTAFIKIDTKPIGGLIGIDFLRKYHAIYAVNTKILYLQTPSYSLIRSTNYLQNYKSIKLKTSPTGHKIIAVRINSNKPSYFLFDTGIPQTMLSLKFAKQLDLKMQKHREIGHGSGGGNVETYDSTVNLITINDIKWHPKKISIMDLKFVDIGMPIDGIIGVDWMLDHKVIIDFFNDEVLVQ